MTNVTIIGGILRAVLAPFTSESADKQALASIDKLNAVIEQRSKTLANHVQAMAGKV